MRHPFRLSMTVLLSLVLIGAPVLLPGCGDDEEDDGMPKTLEGAKDRIRNLEAEIARLNAGIKDIEDRTKADQGDLRLLVSQLRQENDDLARTARLGEKLEPMVKANNTAILGISIVINLLAFMVIVCMQLRHRRLLDECNHYITHRLHG